MGEILHLCLRRHITPSSKKVKGHIRLSSYSGLSLILPFTAPVIAHFPPIPASSQMEAATSIYWKCSLDLKVKLFSSFRYVLFFLPTYIYFSHNHLTIVRVLYDLYGSYGDGSSYTKV